MEKRVRIDIFPGAKAKKERLKTAIFPGRYARGGGRRRDITTEKFLRVFDFGRFANGDDIAYMVDQTAYAFSYSTGAGSFGVPGALTFTGVGTTPDYEGDYNDYILGFDYEDYAETFYEITEDLADYDVSVDGAGAFVPGSGLTIPEEIVELRGSALGLDWDTTGSEWFPDWLGSVASNRTVKITNTPNFADTATTLTLDKSVDVFLSPLIMITDGFARDVPDPFPISPYLPQTFYYNLARYRALTRSAMDDPDWNNLWDNRSNFGSITSGGRAYLRDELIGGSTLLTVVPSGVGAVAGGDISSGTAGFPTEDADTFTSANVQAVGIRIGTLMAVVRKHLGGGAFEWYFIWSNNTLWSHSARAVVGLDV